MACKGCRKDYNKGKYMFCNGSNAPSALANCSFVGGSGKCSFPPQPELTMDECESLCAEESGCEYFSWDENKSCRLYLESECTLMRSARATLADFDAQSCFVGINVGPEEEDPSATPAPTSSVSDQCRASEVAIGYTCDGCRKDLATGQYIGCDGVSDVNATKTNCDEFGGEGDCTFAPETQVSMETCEGLCREEQGCTHFSAWDTGECVLHTTTECNALTETTSSQMALLKMPTSSACDQDNVVVIGDDDGDIDPMYSDPTAQPSSPNVVTDEVFDEPTPKPTVAP
jgi:hypothetical protein